MPALYLRKLCTPGAPSTISCTHKNEFHCVPSSALQNSSCNLFINVDRFFCAIAQVESATKKTDPNFHKLAKKLSVSKVAI